MGHLDATPVHVPLRTSSRKPSQMAPESQHSFGRTDRKMSKAQRFFGTDIMLPQEHVGWKEAQSTRRPSYIEPIGEPKRSPSFHPFPNSAEHSPKPPNLRVRASSPLLGHHYLSDEHAPPLPKPRKVHHSGSSNTLFSYFSSKESKNAKSSKDHPLRPKAGHASRIEPQVKVDHASESLKGSKRKMRPPRIDLSVLFPKPRSTTSPTLLSPQRMVDSPSSVSTAVTDHPLDKRERTPARSDSKRYIDPPRSASRSTSTYSSRRADTSDLTSISETASSEWFDRPLERTVGTSEIDLALDRYTGRRSLFSRSSVYTTSLEQLKQGHQQPQEARKSSRRPRTPTSQPKDMYLSPTSYPNSVRARGNSSSQESWKTDRSKSKSERSGKSAMTKKSSKTTMKNKDLQNVSILCLSSSEDEDDEERSPSIPPRKGSKHRDSMDTYYESEPEVSVAATARATTATAVRHFDRPRSIVTTGSRPTEKIQPPVPAHPRKISESSVGHSSTKTGRGTQSRRSSGVPTISEPDFLSQFPQQPLRSPAELKDMNRRSRYIAVTRAEQDLLEAMRIRQGKITPSLINGGASDRRSVISGPSRDSFCGSDTSFLRLSNIFPPFDTSSLKSTAAYKDGMTSSGSDSDQKTSSPGFSADYSESLPSPATSGASPLTPTLPIHRFSPLPSPKPPPCGPPPPIPRDQKQHNRRRTDSSEAILIDGDEKKRQPPLWSIDFDWNKQRPKVATVH